MLNIAKLGVFLWLLLLLAFHSTIIMRITVQTVHSCDQFPSIYLYSKNKTALN